MYQDNLVGWILHLTLILNQHVTLERVMQAVGFFFFFSFSCNLWKFTHLLEFKYGRHQLWTTGSSSVYFCKPMQSIFNGSLLHFFSNSQKVLNAFTLLGWSRQHFNLLSGIKSDAFMQRAVSRLSGVEMCDQIPNEGLFFKLIASCFDHVIAWGETTSFLVSCLFLTCLKDLPD